MSSIYGESGTTISEDRLSNREVNKLKKWMAERDKEEYSDKRFTNR